MTNMDEVLDVLADGAWVFDPQDKNKPLGFLTHSPHNTYQYQITWYSIHKAHPPKTVTYNSSDLIKCLQPSYAPYLASRPIQWIPVYPDFVEDRYPKIFEDHTMRSSILRPPAHLLEKPDAKTIEALYAYVLKHSPSLRNLYKTNEELMSMIINTYEEDNPQRKEAQPCCCTCRMD